jgi:hypothetical protein
MIKNYLAFIAWALVIFILCAIPGKNLPHYDWADLLSVDKFVHFSLFFIWMVLLRQAWLKSHLSRPVIFQNTIAALGGIAYGGALELMQHYCYTDRSGSWFDFIANSLGAICGVILFKKIIDDAGAFRNPFTAKK